MDNTPFFRGTTGALLAVLALLLTVSAWGQTTGAAAAFEGRPAMAGAQAGQGAQAGPPQGGIGLQGSEGTQLNLRRPAVAEPAQAQDMPRGRMEDAPAAAGAVTPPAKKGVETPRDPGVAKEARGSARGARDAARRTADRVRKDRNPIN